MTIRSTAGAVVLLISTTSCLVAQASSDVDTESRAKEAVAAAASAELLGEGDRAPLLISSGAIELTRVKDIGPLSVWRADVTSFDHGHFFTVAAAAGRIYTLGGFPAPDVSALDSLIRATAPAGMTLRQRAVALALLADPEGAVNTRLASAGAPDSIMTRWLRFRPKNWPGDTVVNHGGRRFARVTLLSERTKALTPVWVPTVYVFAFADGGSLLSWYWRNGVPFGVHQLVPKH